MKTITSAYAYSAYAAKTFLLFLTFVSVSPGSLFAQICRTNTINISTGIDPGTGAALPAGSLDPAWKVIARSTDLNIAVPGLPGTPTSAIINTTSWVTPVSPAPGNSIPSQWITFYNPALWYATTDTSGSYSFTLEREFVLCDSTNITINPLDWARDNYMSDFQIVSKPSNTVMLTLASNDPVSSSSSFYRNWSKVLGLSLSSTWGPGKYAIQVTVHNFISPGANPHGFQLRGTLFSYNDAFLKWGYDSCNCEVDSPSGCHLADPGSGYTVIDASSTTINSSQIWGSKIFVTGGTLIVQGNGTILDATNSDVVFDECSGLEIRDGALLRANNSVFRPCLLNHAWLGVHIKTGGNIIEECSFKDALIALELTDSIGAAKIHNNMFLNNNKGIRIENVYNYPYSITGNRFVVDQDSALFGVCNVNYGNPVAIESIHSSHLENISQNSFIDNNIYYPTHAYRGIYIYDSYAAVTANTFTNMWRSVDIVSNSGLCDIENNKIEVNKEIEASFLNQINITGGYAPVYIFNNEISDPVNYISDIHTGNIAIYADNQEYLSIRNNTIKGFDFGIQLIFVNNSLITENHILNSNVAGIYSEECNLNINCNEIDLNFDSYNSPNPSWGIYSIGIDSNSKIHSNCVLDTRIAMEFDQGFRPLPVIRNNFLFNYIEAGIYCFDCAGYSIGSSTEKGLNTFYRNFNSAFDVYSDALAVDIYDNYNATNNVNVISHGGNYHSTASCAKQTDLGQYVADPQLVCDNYDSLLSPLYMYGNHSMGINTNGNNKIHGGVLTAINAINGVTSSGKYEEIRKTYNVYRNLSSLSANEKLMVDYTYARSTADLTGADVILNNFIPANTNEKIWAVTERIKLDEKKGKTISRDELQSLAQMFTENDKWINMLKGILVSNNIVPDLYFRPARITTPVFDQKPSTPANNSLEVYPNPATDQLNAKFELIEGSAHEIIVTDILGIEVLKHNLEFDKGTITLDVSRLSPGIYIVSVPNFFGNKQVSKFIKSK